MIDAPKTVSSTELLKAAIGEKNQAYYLDKFEQFDEDGDGLHASWNWAAFFFTGLWALYRKMYAWFFVILAFAIIVNMAEKINTPSWVILLLYVPFLGFAVYGNSLYYRKVKSQIANAQASNTDDRKVVRRLNASNGVLKWVPYVFGAIPVIGIVAAITIPAYQNKTKFEFDASTAKLWDSHSSNGKQIHNEQFGKNDKLAPFETDSQTLIKPSQSPSSISSSFSYEDAKYEEATTAIGQRDYTSALKILFPLATQGHADSQWSLAWLYTNGQGVVQDFVEASNLFRLAAQQGHPGAQVGLGMAYADGRGLHRDQVKALMWQNLGANSGNPFMVDGRDRLAQSMTQQQVAQAQQMARECQQRNFKGC